MDDLTAREINTKFDTMEKSMTVTHDSITEKLDRILGQTTEHNHRMTKIELWRSYLIGAWAIVTFFVIPLVLYVNSVESDNLREQLHQNQVDIKEILLTAGAELRVTFPVVIAIIEQNERIRRLPRHMVRAMRYLSELSMIANVTTPEIEPASESDDNEVLTKNVSDSLAS